jgi:hypothetical protein
MIRLDRAIALNIALMPAARSSPAKTGAGRYIGTEPPMVVRCINRRCGMS